MGTPVPPETPHLSPRSSRSSDQDLFHLDTSGLPTAPPPDLSVRHYKTPALFLRRPNQTFQSRERPLRTKPSLLRVEPRHTQTPQPFVRDLHKFVDKTQTQTSSPLRIFDTTLVLYSGTSVTHALTYIRGSCLPGLSGHESPRVPSVSPGLVHKQVRK